MDAHDGSRVYTNNFEEPCVNTNFNRFASDTIDNPEAIFWYPRDSTLDHYAR
jgi:hypothetical protein